MEENIADLFCSLVEIPSPSGSELEVAEYISRYLKKNGIDSYLDNSGAHIRSNSGNLVAEVGGSGPTIMFVAHMDTVETGSVKIRPKIKNGTATSHGNTILGADNKAAVAALVSAIIDLKKDNSHSNIIAVFSAREESGIMGVKYLKLNKKVDYAFIIDGGSPAGTFITRALGQTPFKIIIKGREAHSAVNPEYGRNAIKSAGLIVASQKLGRFQDGSTVNINKIDGGGSTNIIPGQVIILGEVRAFSPEAMKKRFSELEAHSRKACKITGCKFNIIQEKKEGAPPFHIGNNKIAEIAKKATETAGFRFELKSENGTTEANWLKTRIENLIGMSRGGKNPHSKEESIKISEIIDTKKLILSISKLKIK